MGFTWIILVIEQLAMGHGLFLNDVPIKSY